MRTPYDQGVDHAPGRGDDTSGKRVGHSAGGDSGKLQRLLDAISAVGSDLSLSVVLRRITEAAADLVDARYGALGVLDETGQHLVEFITVGMDDTTVDAIGAPPEGHGVLGLLIVEPKPLRLPDLARHPDSHGFPPGHPHMSTFLGVPIRIGGAVFGNLYLTDKRGGGEFTDSDEELAVALAASAATTIETTRLQGRLAELVVVEDRERIARDLHDTVIQRLFATGLTLSGVAGRVEDPDLAARLQEAVDDLDDTVRHIRTTVFELQRPQAGLRSVRRELLDLAADAGRNLGFAIGTRFVGPIDTHVDGPAADHLVAVAREALSNVVRHSGASQVSLEVEASASEVTLWVRDDGIGPSGGEGNGLGNMASRATDLGGTFRLDGAPGSGCTLQWQVPLEG